MEARNSNVLMISVAVLVVMLHLIVASFFLQTSSLRVVSGGRLSSKDLGITVSNGSMWTKLTRPRIITACIWLDGVQSPEKPVITSGDSKYGWIERASFNHPAQAETAHIAATVKSGGRTYIVRQDWRNLHEDSPLPGGETVWQADEATIEPAAMNTP